MRSIERRVQQLETKRTEGGDQVTAIIRQIVSPRGEWAPSWAACGWGELERRIVRDEGESLSDFEQRARESFRDQSGAVLRMRLGCAPAARPGVPK